MYTISVATQEYLQKLIDFANQEGMFYTVTAKAEPEKPTTTLNPLRLRLVTPEFKSFCGNEWLTPKGMISEGMAVECVRNYIEARGLVVDNKILLTDELKYALKMGQGQGLIPRGDLEAIVTRGFL